MNSKSDSDEGTMLGNTHIQLDKTDWMEFLFCWETF